MLELCFDFVLLSVDRKENIGFNFFVFIMKLQHNKM